MAQHPQAPLTWSAVVSRLACAIVASSPAATVAGSRSSRLCTTGCRADQASRDGAYTAA